MLKPVTSGGMHARKAARVSETAAGHKVGFSAYRQIALYALGIAVLTTSSWLEELVGSFSAAQHVSGASWASNAAIVLVYLVCIVRHDAVEKACSTSQAPRALLAVGVASALGRGLSCFAGVLGLPAAAVCLCHAVYEAGVAVLLMTVLCMGCRDAARWAPAFLPLGYAVAALLHFVLRALPAEVVAGAAPVFPLAAGVILSLASARRSTLAPASAASATCADPSVSSWTFPLRPVLLMCVYAFVFNFSLFLSEGPNPYGMLGMLLVSIVALVPAIVRPTRYSASFLYKMALPLMVAGVACLAFLGEGRTVAVLFANSGNVAFTLFMLITLTTLCHRYAVSAAWMFGIVQLSSELAGLAGKLVGAAFTAAYPVGSPESNLVVCCVLVGMVVVSTVVFNDTVVERSFGMVPVQGKVGEAAQPSQTALSGPEAAMSYSERVVWRCGQVARRYGLTLREQEVFELMVQGVSIPDIAERASISYGTAKTHVNHIYKKFDVHSRDEVLALMQREVG